MSGTSIEETDTIAGAATRCGVSQLTIWRLLTEGRLHPVARGDYPPRLRPMDLDRVGPLASAASDDLGPGQPGGVHGENDDPSLG
jgi:hypothetical protein